MYIKLRSKDFSALREKRPIDYVSRDELLFILRMPDLGNECEEQKNLIYNPTMTQKAIVFEYIAEYTKNKKLEKAVYEQFEVEFEKIFNA